MNDIKPLAIFIAFSIGLVVASACGDEEPDTPSCGWTNGVGQGPGYDCWGEGFDPTGTYAFDCPENLVEGEPCGPSGGEDVTVYGCCASDLEVWVCDGPDFLGRHSLYKITCDG